MKILFLSDNFPPEANAPANRTYEHCKEWVKQGEEVTVITCVPNFPKGKVFNGYKNKLYQTEWIDGIKVIRVWSFISANKGKVKRILDYVSYGVMSFFAGLFCKTDIIIATSPQIFTALSGRWLSLIKRKPWIMEVRDIWPESIVAVGAMKKSIVIRLFEWLEKRLYKSADKVVVVTDSFKSDLIKKGIDNDKVYVIKNGADLSTFYPQKKNQTILKQLGLENKFIIGYLGTHGMAHRLDFILNAASKISDPSIQFLFIGNGAEKENLVQHNLELKNINVLMHPSVTKCQVQDYISILDVALVNLKKSDTFKQVIPSKIFENVSMGKPILLGVDGESRTMIENYQAGVFFEPENMYDFITKVEWIKNNLSEYKQGCSNLAKDYDRKHLAHEMLNIIRNEK